MDEGNGRRARVYSANNIHNAASLLQKGDSNREKTSLISPYYPLFPAIQPLPPSFPRISLMGLKHWAAFEATFIFSGGA